MNTENNIYEVLDYLEIDLNSLENEFYTEKIGALQTSIWVLLGLKKFDNPSLVINDEILSMKKRAYRLGVVAKEKLIFALASTPEERENLYENHLINIVDKTIVKMTEEHRDELLEKFKNSKSGLSLSTILKSGEKLEIYVENVDELISEIIQKKKKIISELL